MRSEVSKATFETSMDPLEEVFWTGSINPNEPLRFPGDLPVQMPEDMKPWQKVSEPGTSPHNPPTRHPGWDANCSVGCRAAAEVRMEVMNSGDPAIETSRIPGIGLP